MSVDSASKRNLPISWIWARLGDVGEIFGGGTPSTSNMSYFGGRIPWLTPSDLSEFEGMYIKKGKRIYY